jgi:hypothetical protein
MAKTTFLNRHLKENRMNYFQHMLFALMLVRKTFVCSLASLIHAIFPFMFVYHTSTTVYILNEIFEKRNKNLK